MYPITKAGNFLRRVKQLWGTTGMKRSMWDKEFATGRWDGIENTAGDLLYRYLAKYCNQGSVLDLGCGSGNTSCEMDVSTYGDYTGVDISNVAVMKATKRSVAMGRGAKNTYHQSDIASFTPDKKYDVILFRESILYIPRNRVRSVLERYAGYLKPNGVLIITWYDRAKGEAILALAGEDLIVTEKFEGEASGPLIAILSKRP